MLHLILSQIIWQKNLGKEEKKKDKKEDKEGETTEKTEEMIEVKEEVIEMKVGVLVEIDKREIPEVVREDVAEIEIDSYVYENTINIKILSNLIFLFNIAQTNIIQLSFDELLKHQYFFINFMNCNINSKLWEEFVQNMTISAKQNKPKNQN